MTILELLRNNKISGRLSPEQTMEMFQEIKSKSKKFIDYLNLPSLQKRVMNKLEFNKIQEDLDFFAKTTRFLLQEELSSHTKYDLIMKEIGIKQKEAAEIFKNHPDTSFVYSEPLSQYIVTFPLNINNFKIDAKSIFNILKEWFKAESDIDLFMIYLSIRQHNSDCDQIIKTYTYLEFKKSLK